jgi:hypothetical protein
MSTISVFWHLSLLSLCYKTVYLRTVCTENLEAKMMWLKNFERIQEIQQQIIWQPITELEPRAFIPEVSKNAPFLNKSYALGRYFLIADFYSQFYVIYHVFM